jgi:hypothetical protein
MSIQSIQRSTDFVINELSIVSRILDKPYSIQNLFEELNIYESFFSPVMSGNILIRDAVGLMRKINFDGTEYLKIDISKTKDDFASIKKTFRIYSVSDRKNIGQSSEVYVLNFVSEEFILSEQMKVNRSYSGLYSDFVLDILMNKLNTSEEKLGGIFESSLGLNDIVIPNYKPLTAILWCQNRALDINQMPSFLFFENVNGYNFVSLSRLNESPAIPINFKPKNISDSKPGEILGVQASTVTEQVNVLNRVSKGVDASSYLGFDTLTGSYGVFQRNIGDVLSNIKSPDKTENINFSIYSDRDGNKNINSYDSHVILRHTDSFATTSSYIKKRMPYMKPENMEKVIAQRKAILFSLMMKQITCVLPGNFTLAVGTKVDLQYPDYSMKDKKSDNIDPTLAGKYLIVDSRHMITQDKHSTMINVASAYSQQPLITSESNSQKMAMNG